MVVAVVVVVVVVLSVCLCVPFMFYLFCSYHFVLLLCWGFPVCFAMCSFVCVSFGSVHSDANLLLGTFVK